MTTDIPDTDQPANPNDPVAIDPPTHEYSWDFDFGMGPWTTWLAPSVVHEAGGLYENFTRLNAPGNIDPNHYDGIGALRLVAHLSMPVTGAQGVMNLTDGEFQITIRGTDFQANGAKLVVWLTRYVPEEDVVKNYYVGLTVTNWANTGNDIAAQMTDEWQTITVSLSNDPADWTYAGTNNSQQGDWGDRYQPVDLADTLAYTDATLHLVLVSDEPDQAPTGFLDIANITVRTQTPAAGVLGVQPEIFYGLEDQATVGALAGDPSVDMENATFSLVGGSVTNGVVTIDPDTGAFSFTPDPDFYGPTDFVGHAGFRYQVTDGVTTVEHRAFLFIGPVNDAPTTSAADEAVDIAYGQPFEFTLFNGLDVDRDERLTYHLVPDGATNGTVSLDPDNGRYVFTPAAGFSGAASFSYYVSDGQLDSAPKTVTLTVHAEGDPPTPTTYDEAVDFLIAGDAQTFAYHVVQLAQAGNVNAAYHYGIFLGAGRYVPKDTTLSAYYLGLAVNHVPDANLQLADRYLSGDGVDKDYGAARALLEALPTNAAALYRLGVLENLGFGAPRDDARAVELYLQAAGLGNADAMYTVGRRYLMAEGVEYSPSDAYFWLAVGLRLNGGPPGIPQFDDLLLFNMNQAAENLTPEQRAALDDAAAAWVPGEEPPVNDAPVAGDEAVTATGSTNAPISGTLAEGSDADGNALTYSLVAGSAQNGTVTIDPQTGAYVFTPAAGYVGPASFRYILTDGYANSAETTVNLQFELGTAAAADANSLNEVSSLDVGAGAGLLANDSVSATGGAIRIGSVNGQPANVGQSLAGAHGSITIQADGSYSYVANSATASLVQGETATDSFTYTIVDDENVTSTATLTLTIHGVGGTVITGSGVLIGSQFGDILTGSDGSDVIVGQGGDDIIDGGVGGPNELYGGTGNDIFIIRMAGDTVVEHENEGVDTVQTALAAYTLRLHVENLTFTGEGDFVGTGTEQDNLIAGGAGNDILSGLGGADILVGGAGADVLDGGAGFDTADYSTSAAGVTVSLRTGTGSGGDAEGDTLISIESLVGSAFDDILSGGAGDNTLNGGAGIDTVDYSGAASGVRAQLNTGVASNDGDGGVDTFISIENLTGSAFNDLLIGGGGDNVLSGGDGNDVLIGLAGDDVLIGGGGSNTLQGGLGNDRYIVTSAGDSLLEFAGEGVDTVETTLSSYTLKDHFENLTFTGTGAFVGNGNSAANTLTGGAGDDILIGRGGDDILIGGVGIDTASYAAAASGVRAQLNTGVASNDGDGGVDTFLSIENLTGSAFNDVLIGDAGANVLSGGAGNDILIGLAGDDVLIGGGGSNTLQGGLGDDRYIVTSAGDSLLEFAGEGVDTVETTLSSYTLKDHFENLTFTGTGAFVGNGNSAANTLTGGAGNDVLDGRGGADLMIGGLGDDTYVVDDIGDVIVELAGQGADTVRTTLNAYALGDHLENLTFIGTGAFTGTGNALDNVITGGAGDDRFIAGAGNDRFNGGAGRDTVDYSGAASGVRAQLNSGAASNDGDGGTDIFISIENLTGSAFNDVLIGNAGDNVLSGGDGNDVLIGLAGDDVLIGGGGSNTLQGGLGNDRYIVTSAGDSLLEFAGEGVDTVETTLSSYNLKSHFENLVFTGAGSFVGVGNAASNVITGGAGDDILTGGAGDDFLNGGDGIDTVVLSGLMGDYVITHHGDGSATVVDAAPGTDGDDGTDTLTGIEFLRFRDGTVLELSTLPVGAPMRVTDKAAVEPLVLPAETDDLFIGDGATTLSTAAHLFDFDPGALPGEVERLFDQQLTLALDPSPTADPVDPLAVRDPDWFF